MIECAYQLDFIFGLGRGASIGGDSAGSRLCDFLKNFLFMVGESLDGIEEIGDQIVSAF